MQKRFIEENSIVADATPVDCTVIPPADIERLKVCATIKKSILETADFKIDDRVHIMSRPPENWLLSDRQVLLSFPLLELSNSKYTLNIPIESQDMQKTFRMDEFALMLNGHFREFPYVYSTKIPIKTRTLVRGWIHPNYYILELIHTSVYIVYHKKTRLVMLVTDLVEIRACEPDPDFYSDSYFVEYKQDGVLQKHGIVRPRYSPIFPWVRPENLDYLKTHPDVCWTPPIKRPASESSPVELEIDEQLKKAKSSLNEKMIDAALNSPDDVIKIDPRDIATHYQKVHTMIKADAANKMEDFKKKFSVMTFWTENIFQTFNQVLPTMVEDTGVFVDYYKDTGILARRQLYSPQPGFTTKTTDERWRDESHSPVVLVNGCALYLRLNADHTYRYKSLAKVIYGYDAYSHEGVRQELAHWIVLKAREQETWTEMFKKKFNFGVTAKIDEASTKLVQDFSKKIDKITDQGLTHTHKIEAESLKVLKEATSTVKELKGSLFRMLSRDPKYLSTQAAAIINCIEKIVSLATLIVGMWLTKSNSVRACLVGVFITSHGLTSLLADRLWGVVNWFALRTDTTGVGEKLGGIMVAHGHGETLEEDQAENFFEVIKDVFVSTMTPLKSKDIKIQNEKIRYSTGILRLVKDVKGFFVFLLDAIKRVFEAVYEYTTGIPYEIDGHQDLIKEAVDLVKETHRLLNDPLNAQIKTNPMMQVRVTECYNRYIETSARVMEKGFTRSNFTSFYKTYDKISQLMDQVRTLNRSASGRKKPIAIRLVGVPGLGKSNLVKFISSAMCAYYKIPCDSNALYFRRRNEDFWSGYANQAICVFDEIFQTDDQKIRAREAEEYIACVNDTPFPLNMPDLGSKGATFFNSKVVMSTSNSFVTPANVGIESPLAFKRRADFMIACDVVSDIKNEKGTIKEGIQMSIDHYRLCLLDPITEKPFNPIRILSFGALMREIFALMKKRDDVAGEQEDVVTQIHRIVQEKGASAYDDAEEWTAESYHIPQPQIIQQTGSNRHSRNNVHAHMFTWMTSKSGQENAPAYYGSLAENENYSQTATVENVDKPGRIKIDVYPRFDMGVKAICELIREHERKISSAWDWFSTFLTVWAVWQMISTGLKIGSWILGQYQQSKYVDLDVQDLEEKLKRSKLVTKALKEELEAGKKLSETKKDSQGIYSSAKDTVSKSIFHKKNITVSPISAHMNTNTSQIASVVYGNMGYIKVAFETAKGMVNYGQYCLMVKGRVGICTAHFFHPFFERPDKIANILLEFRDQTFVIDRKDIASVLDFSVSDVYDFAMFHVRSTRFREFPNITHHFISEKDVQVAVNTKLNWLKIEDKREAVELVQAGDMISDVRYELNDDTEVVMSRAIQTTSTGYKEGDCTSVFLHNNPHIDQKIVGIHVAGNGPTGYLLLITQEMFSMASHGRTVKAKCNPSLLNAPFEVVETSRATRLPTETRIILSPIAGKIQLPISKPARMVRTSAYNPYQDVCSKWAVPLVEKWPKELRDVVNYEKTHHKFHLKPQFQTIDEAMTRPKNFIHQQFMERDTSGGYPYNVEKRNEPYKRDFIDLDHKPTPLARQLVGIMLQYILRGGKLNDMVILSEFFKDELRKIQKPIRDLKELSIVPMKGTRGILTSPWTLLTLARMAFGDYLENERLGMATSPIAIGINPHSWDWTVLANYLNIKGDVDPKVLDLDVPAWDAHYTRADAEADREVSLHWYEKGEDRREMPTGLPDYPTLTFEERQKLRCEIKSFLCRPRKHILANVVYTVEQGMATGWFDTAQANSRAQVRRMRCTKLYWARERYGPSFTMERMIAQSREKAYGDDGLDHTVNELAFLNLGHYAIYYKDAFNCGITDAQKNPIQITKRNGWEVECSVPITTLSQVVFLKRRFKKFTLKFRAPLDLSILLEMTNWIRDSLPPDVATLEKAALIAIELWHHGREVFDSQVKLIDDALLSINFPIIPLDYDSIDSKFNAGLISTEGLYAKAKPKIFQHTTPTESPFDTVRPIMLKAQGGILSRSDPLESAFSNVQDDLDEILASPEVAAIRQRAQEIHAEYAFQQDQLNQTVQVVPNQVQATPRTTPVVPRLDPNLMNNREDITVIFRDQDGNEHAVPLAYSNLPTPTSALDRPGTRHTSRQTRYAHSSIVPVRTEADTEALISTEPVQDAVIPLTNDERHEIPSVVDDGEYPEPTYSDSDDEHYFSTLNLNTEWDESESQHSPINVVLSAKDLFLESFEKQFERGEEISAAYKRLFRFHAHRMIGEEYDRDPWEYPDTPEGHVHLMIWASERVDRIHSAATSELVSEYPDMFAVMGPVMRAHMNSEVVDANKKGVISGFTELVADVTESVSTLPMFGDSMKLTSSIFRQTSKLTRSIGLAMPQSVQAQNPMIQENNNLSQVRGLLSARTLGVEPITEFDASAHLPALKDYDLFDNYKLRPGIVGLGQFDANDAIDDVISSWWVSPLLCMDAGGSPDFHVPTPVGHMCSFFSHWTGGLKFSFMFTSAKVLTARIGLVYLPMHEGTIPTTLSGIECGDLYSVTVDIAGDVDKCITIPWSALVPAYPLEHFFIEDDAFPGYANGLLLMRMILPPVAYDNVTDTTIRYSVWMSGAEDFQVINPSRPVWTGDFTVGYQESPMKAHCSTHPDYMISRFEKAFEPIAPAQFVLRPDNQVYGQRVRSFTELMKRPKLVVPISESTDDLVLNIQPLSWEISLTNYESTWFWFLRTFLAHSGSIRVILIHRTVQDMQVSAYTYVGNDSSGSRNAGVAPDNALEVFQIGRNVAEVVMPYIATIPYWNPSYTHEDFYVDANRLVLETIQSSELIENIELSLCVGVADDYRVSNPAPVPPYFAIFTPASKKERAQMHAHSERCTVVDNGNSEQATKLTGFDDLQKPQVNQMTGQNLPLWKNWSPFSKLETPEILERQYLMNLTAFTSSTSQGTKILDFNPFTTLMGITTINDVVKHFIGFRCDAMELEFRVQSTEFHYGQLLISWAIDNQGGHNTNYDNMLIAATSDCVIMSFSAGAPVIVTLPFVTQQAFVDLRHPTINAKVANVRVYILHPARLVGATTTVNMKLMAYAKFIRPQVFAPTLGPSITPSLLKEQSERRSDSYKILPTSKTVEPTPLGKTQHQKVDKLSKHGFEKL